jgi:hypothetical protein
VRAARKTRPKSLVCHCGGEYLFATVSQMIEWNRAEPLPGAAGILFEIRAELGPDATVGICMCGCFVAGR